MAIPPPGTCALRASHTLSAWAFPRACRQYVQAHTLPLFTIRASRCEKLCLSPSACPLFRLAAMWLASKLKVPSSPSRNIIPFWPVRTKGEHALPPTDPPVSQMSCLCE